MPRGVDYRIPLADLLQAAADHQAGFSLRAIARLRWRQWGYASDKSALEGLRHALRTIDAPVRDRIEATIEASTIHGKSRRAMRVPGAPYHAAYRAHRAHLRKLRNAGIAIPSTHRRSLKPGGKQWVLTVQAARSSSSR
jgi:hypothetical protein